MKGPLISLFFTLLLSVSVAAQPGELDLTFGGTGISRLGFDEGDDRGNAAAIQTDGKIVVAGATFNGQKNLFGVARYNVNGSLDSTFDGDGQLAIEIAADDFARAVAIQPDGKIVVAGYSSAGPTVQVGVVRINTDGTLDDTFDSDGIAIVNIGGFSYANALAIDSTGNILVGAAGLFSGELNFTLFRFTTDGILDTAFDSDGIVATEITPLENDLLRSIALLPDGRIVACGDNDSTFVVARYLADGALDPSFDDDGIVTTDVDETIGSSVAMSVAIDTFGVDHKIVVGGYAFAATTGFEMAVVRYNMDGSLDTGFNGNGIAKPTINGRASFGHSVLIQPNDGKIVLAGSCFHSPAGGGFKDFAAARFNDDGSLDGGFDGDGIVALPVQAGDATAYGIVASPGGKLVLAGHSSVSSEEDHIDDFAVVRLNTNATLDTTFDADGKSVTPWNHFPSIARAIAVQPDGKLVVVGDSNQRFAIVRFNVNGTLDSTFGGGGKVRIGVGVFASARAVALQPDGKIVIVGTSSSGSFSNFDFAIARINSDGTPDPTFNGVGIKTIPFGAQQDEANAVVVGPGGKIFVGGMANTGLNTWDFGVASLNSDGTADTSFDVDGKVLTNFGGVVDLATSIALQPDGKILAAGHNFTGVFDVGGAALYDIAIARYNADGSLDTSFGSGGKVTTQISTNDSKSFSMSIQPDGKIVVAGHNRSTPVSTLRFAVVRYQPDGTLDNTFGSGGIVTTSIGVHDAGAFTSGIQADGKILVGGYASILGPTHVSKVYAIARYNSDGSLDTISSAGQNSAPNAWGTGGVVLLDLSEDDDTALGLAIDPQGRVVVAGNSNGVFGVVRLQGFAPTAAEASISGRVSTNDGRGLRNAVVYLTDSTGSTRTARTSAFGYYRLDGITVGQFVTIGVSAKSFRFQPRILQIGDSIGDVDFMPIESSK